MIITFFPEFELTSEIKGQAPHLIGAEEPASFVDALLSALSPKISAEDASVANAPDPDTDAAVQDMSKAIEVPSAHKREDGKEADLTGTQTGTNEREINEGEAQQAAITQPIEPRITEQGMALAIGQLVRENNPMPEVTGAAKRDESAFIQVLARGLAKGHAAAVDAGVGIKTGLLAHTGIFNERPVTDAAHDREAVPAAEESITGQVNVAASATETDAVEAMPGVKPAQERTAETAGSEKHFTGVPARAEVAEKASTEKAFATEPARIDAAESATSFTDEPARVESAERAPVERSFTDEPVKANTAEAASAKSAMKSEPVKVEAAEAAPVRNNAPVEYARGEIVEKASSEKAFTTKPSTAEAAEIKKPAEKAVSEKAVVIETALIKGDMVSEPAKGVIKAEPSAPVHTEAERPGIENDEAAPEAFDSGSYETESLVEVSFAGAESGFDGDGGSSDKGSTELYRPAAAVTGAGFSEIDILDAPSAAQPVQHKESLVELQEKLNAGISISVQKKGGEVRMKLNPENLGELVIRLTIENGNVKADIRADSVEVKQLLETDSSMLREALNSHGLQLKECTIGVSRSEQSLSNGERWGREHSNNGNRENEDRRNEWHGNREHRQSYGRPGKSGNIDIFA